MSDATPQAAPTVAPGDKSMDDIVALCKRRGFVYPASEIYGGINGFWDYGPLGAALKNNIRDWWWRRMVQTPPMGPDGDPVEIVGLDSSIIQNPKTWEASGHVDQFSDPMVEDKKTHKRVRSDHLFCLFAEPAEDRSSSDGFDRIQQMLEQAYRGTADAMPDGIARFSFAAASAGEAWSMWKRVIKRLKNIKVVEEDASHFRGRYDLQHKDGVWRFDGCLAVVPNAMLTYRGGEIPIPSPFLEHGFNQDDLNSLMEPREFNLMLATEIGAVDPVKAYLRPETAQGIFINYQNVVDTMRVKMPFGIAQVGKSFRNEVTPRNFIFRSREFEQMEMEWFCRPDESAKWYEFWKQQRMDWWLSLGVDPANLRFRDHEEDELSHYSKMTVDIEYVYPFTAPGFGELEGIAHRGCFDLTQHQEHSGKKLEYFDQELQVQLQNEGLDKEQVRERSRYIPNVIEPASGLTRAVLVLLCEAYTPDESRPSKVFMKFPAKFAPIKAGVFPLVNKDGMPEVAQKLYMQLREKHAVQYDTKQSIGKRYARMDEAGAPFCFTIDGQTLEDQTVTVRHRDTQSQERMPLEKVAAFVDEQVGL